MTNEHTVTTNQLCDIYANGFKAGGLSLIMNAFPDVDVDAVDRLMDQILESMQANEASRNRVVDEVLETIMGVDTGPKFTIVPMTQETQEGKTHE